MRDLSEIMADIERDNFCTEALNYASRINLQEMAQAIALATSAGVDRRVIAERELNFTEAFIHVMGKDILNIVPVYEFIKSNETLSKLLTEEVETKLKYRISSQSSGEQVWEEAKEEIARRNKKLKENIEKYSTSDDRYVKEAFRVLRRVGLVESSEPGDD